MEVNFPNFPPSFSEQDSSMPNTPTQSSMLSVAPWCSRNLWCKDNVFDLISSDLY